MSNDNVIKLIQPGIFTDHLTEILRNGACALLTQAIEAEVAEFLTKHADLKTGDGHRRVVRHGRLPEREIMTGVGPVAVRQPRVRDRETGAGDPERIRFMPAILPPYARRSKRPEGRFDRRLRGGSGRLARQGCSWLVGLDDRAAEGGLDRRAQALERARPFHQALRLRLGRRHSSAGAFAQCILVIIGATPEGRKELVGFTDGTRESAHDWRTLLLDLKRRGLSVAPELAAADGALGFWKALGEVWPKTREQRCWVHKTVAPLPRDRGHAAASRRPKDRSARSQWLSAEEIKDPSQHLLSSAANDCAPPEVIHH